MATSLYGTVFAGKASCCAWLSRWVCAAVAVSMTFSPPAWAQGSGGVLPGAPETVTLQLKWKHQFQFAGYYAAIEQGYYGDVGLSVTLREAAQGISVEEEVLAGRADFGVGTSELVVSFARGKPLVALAPIFQHSPLVLLVTRASGIETVNGIRGRTAMIEPQSAELFAYLEAEGVSLNQVKLVPHKFDPALLIDGTVDAMSAYSTDEPYLLEEAGVEYLLFTPRAGGIDFYGDTLFTSRGLIDERPRVVKKFLAASLKGWNYALEHPEEMVDLIQARYGGRHSRGHLLFEAQRTAQLIDSDLVEVGYVNPGRWRYIADTYERYDMLPSRVSLDGFLYEQNARTDLRWLLTASAILFGISIATGGIAIWFYRLNVTVRRQAASLQRVLDEIKVLRGTIPICSYCKRIRDMEGAWGNLELYIQEHSEAEFSHGICSECYARIGGEIEGGLPPLPNAGNSPTP